MKRIWAPWRMEYILNSREPGCFMCDIFQGDEDRDNLILRRGRTCAIVMNRFPYTNGHLMAAPYRHIDSIEKMNADEMAEMMHLTAAACAALREVVKPHGFNIGVNIGAVAGAGLKDHVHMHVVPRWEGDTNFMPVLAETKIIPQPLHELWDLLKPLLADADAAE